ncbi:endonuclease VII domain-containing protein [Actinokineospora enzanensis]|uniref:endonuclease VII domain-containing protein n=1 Tax=Actinokineospora enzanensis TaxID=155975 RepID=UPI0004775896|nr:endonuclease VII domain-containing protein [Actinokineospora enzanensis]
MTATPRRCKDCPPGARRRPAPYPGPRCATHQRERTRATREAARERHVQRTYGLSPAEYDALYRAQGGTCFICRRARGTGARRLSVDHDHGCCPGPVSCGGCVRGLLCRSCNRDVLGHLRDDVDALLRAVDYLTDPPAGRVLTSNNRAEGAVRTTM